jgi:hypothetical protein
MKDFAARGTRSVAPADCGIGCSQVSMRSPAAGRRNLGTSLPGEKNRLTAPDSQLVQETFQARLAILAAFPTDEPEKRPERRAAARRSPRRPDEGRARNQTRDKKLIDKSELTLPESRRIRDREHVRSVARHPCLVCERLPSDTHYSRFTQSRALGRKARCRSAAGTTAAAMRSYGGG